MIQVSAFVCVTKVDMVTVSWITDFITVNNDDIVMGYKWLIARTSSSLARDSVALTT